MNNERRELRRRRRQRKQRMEYAKTDESGGGREARRERVGGEGGVKRLTMSVTIAPALLSEARVSMARWKTVCSAVYVEVTDDGKRWGEGDEDACHVQGACSTLGGEDDSVGLKNQQTKNKEEEKVCW